MQKANLKMINREILLNVLFTIILILISSFKIIAASASCTWALTANGNGSKVGNISNGSATYSGVTACSTLYDGTYGMGAYNWPTSDSKDNNKYFQFTISPSSGNDLSVSTISLYTYETGISMHASVYYSTDNFSTSNQAGSQINVSTSQTQTTISSLCISVPNGSTLTIRVYGYWADGTSSSYPFRISSLVISGTTATSCTPPSTQATIGSYTNNTTGNSLTASWTRGNGDAGVIVVGRLTSTTSVAPTSGTLYTANAAFGSGNTTGTGNYVVYNGTSTSVNVTGLTSGTSYTFEVYEYNSSSTCYKNPSSSSAVTTFVLSPGGVTSNLTTWIAGASSGITLTSGKVSSWSNNKSNASLASFSQSDATKRPTVNSNAINYNDAVAFDGTGNTFLENLNFTNFSDVLDEYNNSMIIVQKVNSGTVTAQVELDNDNRIGFENSSGKPRYDYPNDGSGQNVGSSSFLGNFHINSMVGNSSTNTQYLDGKYESQVTHGSSLYVENSSYGFVLGKQVNGSSAANCLIAEMVLYNTNLSSASQNKIESYLAVKYGITLGTTSSTVNYVSSAGTTVWPGDATYQNKIIGVGRDDGEGLLQKQSHQNDDTVKIYLSSLASSNSGNTATSSSFGADNSYVVMGSKSGLMHSTTASNADVPSGIKSRLERAWKITNTNFTGTFSIDFTVNFTTNITDADLRLLVDDNGTFASGCTVFNTGTSSLSLTHSGKKITVSGISTSILSANSTKYITIGSVSTGTPLPIELIEFKANCVDSNIVDIKWATSSEINNDYFTLERSNDGVHFNDIAYVEGAGNSNKILNYSFTDSEINNSLRYYRLKQTDYDGKHSYSGIIAVEPCADNDFSLVVINDNKNHSVEVLINTNEPQNVDLFMQDMTGRLVYQSNRDLSKGLNIINIDVRNFSKHFYIIGSRSKNVKNCLTKKIVINN